MFSICSCQPNIWHAGHCLAPILNWFLLPELTSKLASVDSRIVPVLHYNWEQSTRKFWTRTMQFTLTEWRCQYEESNWAWWIARTAITCPKNLGLPNFSISIVRTLSNLGGLRKWTNFVERVQSLSSWKLGDAKKLSLIERDAKNENFKIFVFFSV